MEYQQSDTDASSQSGLAVGQPQQGDTFFNLRPDWATDGHGLRGPQRPRTVETPATPHPMNFGQDVGPRGQVSPPTGGGTCTPFQPVPGDAEFTGTWVWGVVDGVCQFIDTTDCPTPP